MCAYCVKSIFSRQILILGTPAVRTVMTASMDVISWICMGPFAVYMMVVLGELLSPT